MSSDPSQSTPNLKQLTAQLMQQGDKALEAKKFEEAIACYQKIIEIDSQLVDVYQKLGNALTQAGKLEEAISVYQTAIQLEPNFFWSYNNLGEVFLKLERWQEATATYQKAIELNSDFFWAYNNLGEALVKQEKWQDAIPIYQKAIQLNSEFFWVYNNLGEALIKLEKWQDAIPIYQKAIQLNPEFVWAYGNLGKALTKLERWQAAAEVYQKATQFHSDLLWLQEDYAESLIHLQRWQEAETVLRHAVELEPKSYLNHYKLGKVLMQLQCWQDAINYFNKTLEIKPNFKSAEQKLKEATQTLQYIQNPTGKTPITELESIDLLKYYPVWGESNHYIFYQSDQPSQDPETGHWDFDLPPKELMFVFSESPEYYLNSGEVQISLLQETLEKAGYFIQAGSRVLDFGCASGRMIRHLEKFAETCEIWGTDISGDCISWCQQNLSPPFNFFMGTTHPHLPFEDGYFDVIYAGSVFTHIDDLADAWFLELRRILKPGGMAYVTIQEQHLIETVKEFSEAWLDRNNIWLPDQKTECYQKYQEYSQSNFSMFTLGRDTRSLVFYDLDYFCQKRQPWFKTVNVRREAYYWQTAILLERQ
jgi:tetratricopeptide (TPR) repeat protein/ubiquinone/menaquinone biosynthesis C-methylase UbiE